MDKKYLIREIKKLQVNDPKGEIPDKDVCLKEDVITLLEKGSKEIIGIENFSVEASETVNKSGERLAEVLDDKTKNLKVIFVFGFWESEDIPELMEKCPGYVSRIQYGKLCDLHNELIDVYDINSKEVWFCSNEGLLNFKEGSEYPLINRDQVYFVRQRNDKKNKQVYSLLNIGGIRNNTNWYKAYVEGRFEAVWMKKRTVNVHEPKGL